MATAGAIIKAAARALQIVPGGGDLTSAQYADGLELLNDLLAQWSVESLLPVAETQENFDLVAGTASYTIGTGGAFNTTRPTRLLSGFIRSGDQDYPLQVLQSESDYTSIPDKTTTGIPYQIYYKDAYPLGTLYLYFAPNLSTYDLYTTTQKAFTQLATQTTAVSLPDEYVSALKPNLAVVWGNEFGREIPPNVVQMAGQRYINLKRLNNRVPIANANPFGNNRLPDINRGY